jgi:peptidoglycan/xylan/chitin deacetylase (PgdA/CDA1 family)
MYHHIIDPVLFSSHLNYLASHNYQVVPITSLNDFFDRGIPLPAKPVILTFDDAYADFAANALPVLRQNSTPATVFVPTGLVNNPGYLSWQDLASAPGYIYFANHTWSHSTKADEIGTAQTQLADHGFNSAKIFAYPYGTQTKEEIAYLSANGFTLAFTTRTGSVMCAQQRLSLPRLRAPNASLSSIGL